MICLRLTLPILKTRGSKLNTAGRTSKNASVRVSLESWRTQVRYHRVWCIMTYFWIVQRWVCLVIFYWHLSCQRAYRKLSGPHWKSCLPAAQKNLVGRIKELSGLLWKAWWVAQKSWAGQRLRKSAINYYSTITNNIKRKRLPLCY